MIDHDHVGKEEKTLAGFINGATKDLFHLVTLKDRESVFSHEGDVQDRRVLRNEITFRHAGDHFPGGKLEVGEKNNAV